MDWVGLRTETKAFFCNDITKKQKQIYANQIERLLKDLFQENEKESSHYKSHGTLVICLLALVNNYSLLFFCNRREGIFSFHDKTCWRLFALANNTPVHISSYEPELLCFFWFRKKLDIKSKTVCGQYTFCTFWDQLCMWFASIMMKKPSLWVHTFFLVWVHKQACSFISTGN